MRGGSVAMMSSTRSMARAAVRDFVAHREYKKRRADEKNGQALVALSDLQAGKPGNNLPKMAVTKRDVYQASLKCREALRPEPIPPGKESYEILRMLEVGPATKRQIANILGISIDEAEFEIRCLLDHKMIVALGHRKRYGNRIQVYGLPSQEMPIGPVDDNDIEGIIGDYIRRRRTAKFSDLKRITGAGDAAVTTALTSLMRNGKVQRIGSAGTTSYVWLVDES